MKVLQVITVLLLLMLFAFGCSKHSTDPIMGSGSTDLMPSIAYNGSSILGLMGAYDLFLSPDGTIAELTPMRMSTIGEGYIVNGLAYFTVLPCADCLKLKSISFDGPYVKLTFKISHPFEKGNTSEPPTAKNRLDLDVFDMALVILPKDGTATSYTPTSESIYDSICVNIDGYTTELANVTGDSAACPYFLVIDDNDSGTLTNNKFEMGMKDVEFDTWFQGGMFTLYLTMGYGASATKPVRLTPTYYIPEFNRKAAWKVDVAPQVWSGANPSTVTIDIYDWNHGATVAGTYPDSSNTDHILASSNIQSVTVEVPGMTAAIVSASTIDTTTDGYSDPITYTATFANENGIADGTYTGLVKVTDSRTPGTFVIGGETDTLVDTADGVTLSWFNMPEYAVYQTFTATIGSTMNGWAVTWGGALDCNANDVATDSNGNLFVIGEYYGTVDFDPSPGGTFQRTASAYADMFLTKFDSSGNWLWTNVYGSTGYIIGNGVAVDSNDDVYITGYFENTVDFNPGAGDAWRTSNGNTDILVAKYLGSDGSYVWAQGIGSNNTTWGDVGWDIAVDSANDALITGHFYGTCCFNPPGGDPHTKPSSGSAAFLARYNSTNGMWHLARSWCTENDPSIIGMGFGVTTHGTDAYVTGSFSGTNVSFGAETHSQIGGSIDIFLTKFDISAALSFTWTKTWDALTGRSVATDQLGNVLVAGEFENTVDFDPGGPVVNHISNGGWDAFVSKFDSSGNFTWARTWGSTTDNDWPYGVATDSAGSVMVCGQYGDLVDFDTSSGTLIIASNGAKDVFLSKHDDLGNFIWAHSIGGITDDRCNGVTTDLLDQIYITGVFSNTVNFDIAGGTDIHISPGMHDSFLKMFYP